MPMNRSRTTTTTETYTAHYNLSRSTEGPSLKGPFKTWNPQPRLLSESETDTAAKRHPSHARTVQNAPSAHPAVTNHNHTNYPLMPNSRTTSSFYTHQRVSSPAPHRSDHTAAYAYPMEPVQQHPARPKQSSSMLNFIRSHSNAHESKVENTSSRRGDDLRRAVVTSSKQFQSSSSSANPAVRAPAPPVSYSSASSTETSPRNSTDGHQAVNNVSDAEYHRHHHHTRNPSVASKLNTDFPSRKTDATSSSQRTADKKAKDRQDMVAKVTEAFSPPMSTRSRVPENISLGQLSLLRGDDSTIYRRTASTVRGSESQTRTQAYSNQPMSSQPQQRLPPQDLDPGAGTDPGSKGYRPQARTPVEPPMRSQPTPTLSVPQSKSASASLPRAPPPQSSVKSPVSSRTPFLAHLLTKKNQSSSSRTAANPWPFNQASVTERAASKQSSKEQPTRSGRTQATPNPPHPQPPLDVANPTPMHSRESSQLNKADSRYLGPPVPPKQVASYNSVEKSSTEEANSRPPPIPKSTTSRGAGNNDAGNQLGYSLPPSASALPPSSIPSATQVAYLPKLKPEPNHSQAFQVRSDQNQTMLSDADFQMKSPVPTQQLSVRPPSKPTHSTASPIPSLHPSQAAVPATAIEQTSALPSAGPKSPALLVDLSLSLIPVESVVTNHKLYERFPIQEHQAEALPVVNDKDRLSLVRPGGVNSRNASTVPTKETVSVLNSSADIANHDSALIRTAAASQGQPNNGKSTPPETNQSNTPLHIQWIPPPESETSSLSSAEEDDYIAWPKPTNGVSQASVAAGVWTAPQKAVLRPGEMSYASQAPNLYVASQKLPRSNPPTPPEPAVPEVDPQSTEAFNIPTDVSIKNPVTSMERFAAGAWTTKAITNNNSVASTAPDVLPKPPAKAIENAPSSSKSAEVARNGSAVGMTPGAWNHVTKYNINKPTTIFEVEKTNEPCMGNSVAATGQAMSSTMRHALNGSTPAGAWTTKATQPDHQFSSQHFNSNTTLKPSPRDASPPSATPKYQTTPATGSGSNTPSSTQSVDHHSNVGPGTSHIDRVPISGHPSTPAPSRPSLRQTPPPLSISSTTPDTDSLLTPSSLNSPRSTLLITQPPPPAPVTASPPQPPVDKEKSSKNRILDFFRHKPSTTTNASYDVWMPPKQPSKEKEKIYEEKTKEAPAVIAQARAKTIPSTIPVQSQPSSRPKSPKLFSPLKLFSKRNRTVSTASIDALDGTTTTVMNSPSSSAPDIMGTPYSPPVRDALLAIQEWRDNEANRLMRSKRPHRPGVTFDCVEDIAPVHMVPSRYKLSRSYHTEDDEI